MTPAAHWPLMGLIWTSCLVGLLSAALDCLAYLEDRRHD